MKPFTIRLLTLATLLLSGIPAAHAESHGTDEHERRDLEELMQGYASVHEGLAGDSLQAARAGAVAIVEGLPADSLKALRRAAQRVADAADLDAARSAFASLSGEVLLLASGPQGEHLKTPLFKAHCPMALGKGADWLQVGKKVANPYFGSAMYGCGSIGEQVAGPRETPRAGDGRGMDHGDMHAAGDGTRR